MMTATLNGTLNSAPDTPSPVYPDRLIRPLPKRTLRSRLSTDAADTIHYPPTPPASQIFYGLGDTDEVVTHSKAYARQTIETDHDELTPEADCHHNFDTAVELESGDEDGPVVVRRSTAFRGSLSPASSPHPQGFSGKEGSQKSSAGPDGYDAFENTNNKKKRKIPTPGNMSSHHSALSPEFASMGLANPNSSPTAVNDGTSTGAYYGSGNPASPLGSGISGSGRGRLGRSTARGNTSRNPLSANAQNAWMNTRTPSRRDGLMSSPGPSGDPSDQGIISTAIANAATLSSRRGSSNVSLLDQENTTPTKTQFTFTCESDSAKGMAMQMHSYSGPHHSPTSPLAPTTQNPRGFSTQGTQTSPNVASPMSQQVPMGTQPQPSQVGEQGSVGRKKKRSPGSIYALAARQRKIQQQYTNIHHPPSLEDIWICEFCEYESIFGHPPEALIRQYEIKDRKERKRLAEKKRLLEKAKMKGRKTKKAPKNSSKNASSQQAYHQGYDRASVDHSSATGSGHAEDDYLGHEYDEEPEPIPAPDPASSTDLKPPLLPGGNHPKLAATMGNPLGSSDTGTSRPA
ncbi:hypothetical protein N7462_003914 [Penicillium macrosclerotiorum]|uniref:uncharacterized protein n=1 Tax=Penicillium macrosclerotiorum TaxID=303699 RepID=UPI002547684F|nr:uncharacterized protein N7462_003914 [Penicillium macrosclerotiorum]KAJ5689522.1 hypothetical protein N7462_003914 [Penicillium macrosclerotiorum]